MSSTPNMVYSDSRDAISDLRRRSKDSLYFFAKTICGMKDLTPRFHMQMAAFLQIYPWNGGPPESNRKLLVTAREHFKSSIGTVARALWLLIHNPEWSICIMSAKEDHPKKWLRQIKQIIETNPLFQRVFPEIEPDYKKWDDTEILIKRPKSLSGQAQASITAASMLAGQASQHFDHILLDDPVNERIAASDTLMQQAKEFYDHLEALTKDWKTSSFDVTGTPWGRGDVIQHAMDTDVELGDRLFWWLNARGEFKMSESLYKTHPQCVVDLPQGEPVFPERVDERKLQRLENKNPEAYYLQYLCKPYDAGQNGFNLDLIRNYAHMSSGNLQCDCHPAHDHSIARMSVIAVSDPAVTLAKRGCNSSVLVLAKAACGCRFMLHEYSNKVLPQDLMGVYTDTGYKWQPWLRTFGIEAVAFQTVFKAWLEEKQSRGEFPLGVQFVDPKPNNRGKDERTSGQLTPVANGLWHKLPTMQHVSGRDNLLDQIYKWPYGDSRDLLDAWSYCDEVWAEAAPPQTALTNNENSTIARNRAREQHDLSLLARSDD